MVLWPSIEKAESQLSPRFTSSNLNTQLQAQGLPKKDLKVFEKQSSYKNY